MSVQYNDGFLPDILLLTRCFCHPGTHFNPMKGFSCLRAYVMPVSTAPEIFEPLQALQQRSSAATCLCIEQRNPESLIFSHVWAINGPPCVCALCVFSSHSFWTSSSLDVPAGVTQEEGHTGFLIHLLSAVRALIFFARRIQPFLSLVDREVEFCVLTI